MHESKTYSVKKMRRQAKALKKLFAEDTSD